MRLRAAVRPAALTVLGAVLIAAFFDAAKLHGGYALMRAGIRYVPRDELVYLLWYLVWGTLALIALGGALHAACGRGLTRTFERIAARPPQSLVAVSLFVFVLVIVLRHHLLLSQPIADDELVYELNARNIALGRLTSIPSIDPEFLSNMFVIVDLHRWHGKYPIGHSLLLAPFELLGRPDLLGALLAVASLTLTFVVGRRFVSPRVALLGALLLALSPHFLLTHATLMSQSTSTLVMLLAVYLRLRARETGQRHWLVLMGLCLGFGILTRPLPLSLVAAVLVVDVLVEALRAHDELMRVVTDTFALGLPIALMILVFMTVNYVQSGSPWTAGYNEVHSSLGMFQNIDGELTNSVGAALVRENVWLFGWPCSLALAPLARIRAFSRMFWALIATALAYRLMVPKTVVATTGPIYLTEIVPWLCLASGSGIAHVSELLKRLSCADARERVASLVVASFVVSLCAFVPVQSRAILQGALARESVFRELREEGGANAVVFGEMIVAPESGLSWAFFPPNPWPDLRDEMLFLRVPVGDDGVGRAWDLWRTRFSDRPAFVILRNATHVLLRRLDPRQRPAAAPPTSKGAKS